MLIYPFLNNHFDETTGIQVNEHGQVFKGELSLPRVSNLVYGTFSSAGETPAIIRGREIHDTINASHSTILNEVSKSQSYNFPAQEKWSIKLDGGGSLEKLKDFRAKMVNILLEKGTEIFNKKTMSTEKLIDNISDLFFGEGSKTADKSRRGNHV